MAKVHIRSIELDPQNSVEIILMGRNTETQHSFGVLFKASVDQGHVKIDIREGRIVIQYPEEQAQ